MNSCCIRMQYCYKTQEEFTADLISYKAIHSSTQNSSRRFRHQINLPEIPLNHTILKNRRWEARQGRNRKGKWKEKGKGGKGKGKRGAEGRGRRRGQGWDRGKQVYCDFLYLSHIGYLRNDRTFTRKYLSDNPLYFTWIIGLFNP